jgi:GT2 family glycosyltransferase
MQEIQKTTIAVIVPVHNSSEHLAAVLEPLKSELRRGDELLVVDDRSSDGSPDIACSLGVRVIESSGRPGAAGTRNTGASAAESDWFLFVDSDAVVPSGWRSMLADRIDEKADAVQAVYSRESAGKNPATFYKNFYYFYTFTRRIRKKYINGCGTFFFAVSRDMFLKLGGFDEKISGATVEDADFAARLIGAGGRILLARGIEVFHLREYTLRKLMHYDWKMMIAKSLYLMRRGREHGTPSVSMASPGEMMPVITGAAGVWGIPFGISILLLGSSLGAWIALAGLSVVVLGHLGFWIASVKKGGMRGFLAGLITYPDLLLVAPALACAAILAVSGRKY